MKVYGIANYYYASKAANEANRTSFHITEMTQDQMDKVQDVINAFDLDAEIYV